MLRVWLISSLILLSLLPSCMIAPSAEIVQTAIAKTQAALPSVTFTPQELPKKTQEQTNTPQPTYTPTQTNTPRPTNTPVVGIRANPIPLGKNVKIQENNREFSLTIKEVIRGDKAWQLIDKANMFNYPPSEGEEYVLIYLTLDYPRGASSEDILELDFTDFYTVSKNKVLDFWGNQTAPEPQFSFTLFPGGNGEGWLAKRVYLGDTNPLLTYGDPQSSAIYFSLTN